MEKNWNLTMRLNVPKIHRDILLRTANVSRIFTTRYCVTMYVTASMYFILPLITDRDSSFQRPRKYPFCAWYYYDQTSDVLYVMFYLSQVNAKGYKRSTNLGYRNDRRIGRNRTN